MGNHNLVPDFWDFELRRVCGSVATFAMGRRAVEQQLQFEDVGVDPFWGLLHESIFERRKRHHRAWPGEQIESRHSQQDDVQCPARQIGRVPSENFSRLAVEPLHKRSHQD
jgi:hypothetical protein